MSLLETIAEWVMGGPPQVQCAGCGQTVPGDNLGACEPESGLCWCRACNDAGLVPDEV